MMQWLDELVGPIENSIALNLDGFSPPFKDYLRRKYDELGSVRTIVDQYKSVPLDSVYVPAKLRSPEHELSEKDFIDRVESGESFAIEGLGGAGKSMLMRSLWRSIAKRGKRVPLLLELRAIKFPIADIRLEILANCFGDAPISVDQLDALMSDGRFAILLDGFDEVPQLERKNV